ncbi:hypothetical protein D3C86_1297180 [compost metagenome]
MAAVTPCSERPAINTQGDSATPQISEAMAKPIRPTKNILMRPKMSPSRPPVISVTA